MMPWAGMASLPIARRANPPTSTARTRTAAQLHVAQRAAAGVEGHVIGRQARVLPVPGSEAGIVPERLGVGGEQVEGEREPPGEELAADLLGGDAEAEDDSVAARIPLPPVGRVALELEPPAGVEGDDPEGTGPDGPLLRARAHGAGPLRQDRGRRVGDDGREEGDGLLEVDEELARRDDVEALEVGGLAGDEPPCAPDGREQPPVHGRRHEEPLPGVAHVARRQPPPVVEPHARAQPEPVPPPVALREHLRGDPGHDPRALERPREGLEEAGRHLAVLQGLAEGGIEAPDDAGDGHVEDPSARPAGGRARSASASAFPSSA